ncbi:unnamed protein product [Cylindrotheca closterium]|uniref:Uncharacterized protein n=1 Tax=Cylindrotheca closterium TaxID=2856 RepID=A0AAD2FZY9_9STRA|nr:unnamed protein product [Cylindrotheca closterium]
MVEISCVLAAVFLMTGNILKIVYYANVFRDNHGTFDWETYTTLDPGFISAQWETRISRHNLFLASGFMNTIGWLFLAYPILQMAWILSKGGSRALVLNVVIGLLCLAGAITELISNFVWLGMSYMSEYMVYLYGINPNEGDWLDRPDMPDDDGYGWRVLEMVHIVCRGFIIYVDSFEWIALAGVFIFTFASVRGWLQEDQTSFGSRWNTLGLFIGFVCILEFVAEILRFEENMRFSSRIFGIVSIIYAVLNRIIFIPAWILSLGVMIPRATMKMAFENPAHRQNGGGGGGGGGELQMTEIRPESAAHDGNDFTIDDVEEEEDHPPTTKDQGPARSPPPAAFTTTTTE